MKDLVLISKPNEIQPINVDLFSRFLEFIDVKEATAKTYSKCINQFFRWIRDNSIDSPKRQDVLNYREHLKKELQLKPSTIQTYIISLKQFFKWIEAEGIAKDITKNIKGAKVSREFKKDYFTAEQIKNIISQDLSKRDRAIISLAVTGGLRTIEILRANIEDLRTLGNKTVLYIQGKGRDEKTEYVEIPLKVEQYIREYLATRKYKNNNSPLFTSESHRNNEGRLTTKSISRLIKEAFIKAGYNSERLTAHSLRHTTATLNLIAGASLEETKEYLRHANINTTMIYAHHLKRANNNSAERVSSQIF